VTFQMMKGEEPILTTKPWMFELLALPKLDIRVSLYPKFVSNGDNFELQLFNEREEVVFRKQGIRVQKGSGSVEQVRNIALGKRYRAVLLKENYLPRQEYIVFSTGSAQISFRKMYPLDLNRDGRFSFQDVSTLFRTPSLFNLLVP